MCLEMSIPEFGPKFQGSVYLCRGGEEGRGGHSKKKKSQNCQNRQKHQKSPKSQKFSPAAPWKMHKMRKTYTPACVGAQNLRFKEKFVIFLNLFWFFLIIVEYYHFFKLFKNNFKTFSKFFFMKFSKKFKMFSKIISKCFPVFFKSFFQLFFIFSKTNCLKFQKFKTSAVDTPRPSGRVASPGPKARDEGLDREARGL